MGELEFYKDQVRVWGEDYVEDLINRGYAPKLTSNGWYWVYMPDTEFVNRELDTEPVSCYSAPVGA